MEVTLNELSKSLGSVSMSEERTHRLVEALFESIHNALVSGKDVSLSGFGSFSLATKDGSPLPALYNANVIGEVCSRLGEANENRVRVMIEAIVEALKKELLDGKRVVLDGLGTLEVAVEPPRIERQPKGHRLIKPASSSLEFLSPRIIQTQAGEGHAVFEPADEFRKRVESFRASTIMLIVPERDFFAKTLEYYFESAGWDIEVFDKIPRALEQVTTGKAYLAILDALFEDHQDFCAAVKLNRETNRVPLIILHPSQAAFKNPKGVWVLGDGNLVQPFEFRELLDMADREILREAEEQLIFTQQVALHLPTEESVIERAIEVCHRLLEASGLTEEGQVAVGAAFREAVVNAAQHGNKYKKEKKVEVQYLLDREKITVVVRDQGAGFDHEQFVRSGATKDAISAARERHQQGRMGGLGIMLMLRCCDRLEYNEKGNQITLTKLLAARR